MAKGTRKGASVRYKPVKISATKMPKGKQPRNPFRKA